MLTLDTVNFVEVTGDYDASVVLQGEADDALLERGQVGVANARAGGFAMETLIYGTVFFQAQQTWKIFAVEFADETRDQQLAVLLQFQRDATAHVGVVTIRERQIGPP